VFVPVLNRLELLPDDVTPTSGLFELVDDVVGVGVIASGFIRSEVFGSVLEVVTVAMTSHRVVGSVPLLCSVALFACRVVVIDALLWPGGKFVRLVVARRGRPELASSLLLR